MVVYKQTRFISYQTKENFQIIFVQWLHKQAINAYKEAQKCERWQNWELSPWVFDEKMSQSKTVLILDAL